MAITLTNDDTTKTVMKVTANIANAHHTFGHRQISPKTMDAVNTLLAAGQMDEAFQILTLSSHKHPAQVADVYNLQASKQRTADMRARLREKLKKKKDAGVCPEQVATFIGMMKDWGSTEFELE